MSYQQASRSRTEWWSRWWAPHLAWISLGVIGVLIVPSARQDISTMFFLFMLVVFGPLVYFIPTFVAHVRRHKNKTAITVLNIFGGWTFVGWIVAIVWSFTAQNTNNQT